MNMLRTAVTVARYIFNIIPCIMASSIKCLLSYVSKPQILSGFLTQPKIQSLQVPQIRTLIKLSLRKGKRKSIKAVTKRFFRLAWGGWIRTIQGRKKHLWKKREKRRNRYRQHVFCSSSQSHKLDRMVCKFWKRRKYYVDDPYEPYHSREHYMYTRKNFAPAPPRKC
ncbi:hypothetical protein L9F63_004285 [Diploptera punctata]|uniref:Large ribosomal subunit protein bL35m n=1 Tax=Diploptera punctata TaxID=6984 RepID=A0AAD8E7I6_DIPPU|nr:hypothetical protein L9F63_004285 [Diploptera punctata]